MSSHNINPYALELAKLRARIDDLEYENVELRAQLYPKVDLSLLNRLTETETHMLRHLLGRSPRLVERNDIIELTGISSNGNCLAVYIWKINAKLRPIGAKIQNIWGRGYRIDKESANIIRQRSACPRDGVEI